MNLRTIPRAALGGYLSLLKLPLSTAARVLGRNGNAATSGPELVVDRADAAFRDTAGVVLGDPQLREDAGRRRAAADHREKALRLRGQAQQTTQQADEQLTQREQEAERKRQQAEQRAEQRRQQASKEREERKRKAAKATNQRKAASAKASAKTEKALEDTARRDRLQALEEKSEALSEREDALTAADEAQRLRDAAGKAKAARKSD